MLLLIVLLLMPSLGSLSMVILSIGLLSICLFSIVALPTSMFLLGQQLLQSYLSMIIPITRSSAHGLNRKFTFEVLLQFFAISLQDKFLKLAGAVNTLHFATTAYLAQNFTDARFKIKHVRSQRELLQILKVAKDLLGHKSFYGSQGALWAKGCTYFWLN